jgi:eukaryotic-like serine/threonine-protein kinase
VTPGTVLSGKYKLISLLGEGGMGAVWRAEDLRLAGAPVAIKLMHSRDASQPEIRARFEQEVRTAAKLRNPHVAQVYDVGVDEQTGAPFFAMELLEGETLKERLVRGGLLDPAEVARVVSHVAHGLSRAHELGIVHRDLKPANIFLVQNADGGLAKVLDFGIAKRSSHSLMQGATATGMLLGTPYYMSPEQILSSKDVDHRSDIWSLAVIAVECLTGRLPFEADNLPGLSLAICQGRSSAPSLLGDVPPGFDAWFFRATSLDRELRFASALQLAEELRNICGTIESQRSAARALGSARAGAASGSASGRAYVARPSPSTGPVSRTATSGRELEAEGPSSSRKTGLLIAAVTLLALGIVGATWVLLHEPADVQASLPGASPAPAAAAQPPPATVAPPPEPKPQVEVRMAQPGPAVEPVRVAPIASPAPVAAPEAAAAQPHLAASEPAHRGVQPTRLTPAGLRAVAKPKPSAPKRAKPADAARPATSESPASKPASNAPPEGLSPF